MSPPVVLVVMPLFDTSILVIACFCSVCIFAVLALNVKSLPLCTTSIVFVSLRVRVSPPFTAVEVVSDPSLIFHAAASFTALFVTATV